MGEMVVTPELHVAEVAEPEHRLAILNLLSEYNRGKAGDAHPLPLAILLRDAARETVGGLYAVSAYDWLIVELLFVPEQARGAGLGSKLLARAEEIARLRGCAGVWLDTFSFQARGFYERLGYGLFGEVEDHPFGESRYFLKKLLA